MYNKVTQADIDALRAIVGPENVLLGEGINPDYAHDELGDVSHMPEVLVRVRTTREVSEMMRLASARVIPVTVRGSGTGLVGAAVPICGGILLETTKMNEILSLDTENLTVTVQPGVLLMELAAFAEEHDLLYPPDPGEKFATLGGNVSTNAGGMRAVKYGVTRDYVRGLTAVLADGTVLELGGKQIKDASGLSLKQLLIGSEGTLAVITRCTLALLPKPETSLSVLVPYPDLDTGIRSVLAVLQAGANPTAVEFLERSVVELGEAYSGSKYPRPDAGSYLLLTFDGRALEVQESLNRVNELVLSQGALDVITLQDAAQAAEIWRVRGALVKAAEAVSEQEPMDIVVPISKTAEFIRFIHALEAKSGVRMIGFGHAGDGNVHLCVMRDGRDQETWDKLLHETAEQAYEEAYRLGGVASGEHGIGLSKRSYFLRQTQPEVLTAMNQIKNALDPKHILNDQKSYVKGETNHADTV